MVWPRILVTGGTGLIGGWVVDALCSAGATDVVAGVRRPSPRLERVPVKLVHCDLMDRESLETALQGIEVVIHCGRDPAKGATVEGTRSDPRPGHQAIGSDEFNRRLWQCERRRNGRSARILRKIAQGKPNLESALSAIEKTFQRDVSDEPRSRFSTRVVYSNDRARRVGLKPRTSLQDGVSASVEWAKSKGLIKQ
jgi:nucleoside-diphosphate-sugar epimerase